MFGRSWATRASSRPPLSPERSRCACPAHRSARRLAPPLIKEQPRPSPGLHRGNLESSLRLE
jgi:hypothetical protein